MRILLLSICAQKGYSWHVALAAVFIEGIIFIILSAINVREAIFNAIPANMKKAVSVGIGMYIAHRHLQNAVLLSIMLLPASALVM